MTEIGKTVPRSYVAALLMAVAALLGRDYITGDEATRLGHARDMQVECLQHEIDNLSGKAR